MLSARFGSEVKVGNADLWEESIRRIVRRVAWIAKGSKVVDDDLLNDLIIDSSVWRTLHKELKSAIRQLGRNISREL